MTKPTTGKYSVKDFQCTACGVIEAHGTNHWGEIYPRCRECGWKRPMEMGQRFICLETCPKTHDLPEPWETVELGDIIKVLKKVP